MMGIDRLGSEFRSFFSEEAHELREVDARGAALETATAGETGPEFAVPEQFVSQTKECLFHNKTGREAGEHSRDRTAPGTDPTI